MNSAGLYEGFTPPKQAEYEQWLIDRYGSDMREPIAHSRQRWDGRDETSRKAAMTELQQLEEALAEACRRDVDCTAASVDALVARHRAWVAGMWGRPCPAEAYAGLANLYLAHPDFVARYENLAPGFANYLATAMKAHAGSGG